MKMLALFFPLILPYILNAQISIVSTDMPVIGDTITRNVDTLTTETEGPSGVNQVWDFTGAAAHNVNATRVVSVSNTPYASDYPSSNMAMTNDNVSFIYFDAQSSFFNATGAAGDLLNNGVIIKAVFNPDLTLYQFPTDYGNNYSDTYEFDITTDGTVFDPTLEKIRIKHTGTVYDSTDAWGTVITDIGSYNTLRVKRVEYSIDSVWTKPFFLPFIFLNATIDTSKTYAWISKEGKLAVAELNFDSLGNPNNLTWTTVPAIPVANFTYTDNSGGIFSFSDLSTNTPDNWSWDFGDGGNSNAPSPPYQYTTDGTYNVCLTISNTSGSDTFCDSVVVTGATPNPPPIASFTFVDSLLGKIYFMDQSANTPTSWAWVFDDGNTSTEQSPFHQYTSNGSYTVCLTATNGNGSNTFCDTVTGVLVGIENWTDLSTLVLFPNPADHSVTITIENPIHDPQVVISNTLGQVVLNSEFSGEVQKKMQLDLPNLQNGIYLLQLKNEDGALIAQQKFLIEH
ncbi:MAG: hypothetical protein COB85_02265 [Bacteroidetes bacterium]|nr:MAG: hypothetical protein COB85_02265 [Bacteroidota bacterium]